MTEGMAPKYWSLSTSMSSLSVDDRVSISRGDPSTVTVPILVQGTPWSDAIRRTRSSSSGAQLTTTRP